MPDLATVVAQVDAARPDGLATVDLGIDRDGRIGAIGPPGTLTGARTVDGRGLLAVPGGVDVHVHIDTFFGGTTTRDDFFTGTVAALFGGTTTIAQFAIPRPAETSLDAAQRTRAAATADAVADVVVHGAIVRDTFEASMAQIPALRAMGVNTIKAFSAYTDVIGLTLPQIERLLGAAASAGIVVFMHAETDSMIRAGVEDAVARLELGPTGHAVSRSADAEADAVTTIGGLARASGATVYFVHISSADGVAAVGRLKRAGAPVLAETCPHYLFLDGATYAGPDGQRWICSPPIRADADRRALWSALADGVIDAVSSDHNCFDVAQKDGAATDFRQVPNGLPGIETRMPLLIGAAIDGRLAWPRFVEVVAAGPARSVGQWPRKGGLVVGADADVVLVDPSARTDLSAGHMATDFAPFAGVSASGRIVSVYRRGAAVIADGRLAAERGSGASLRGPDSLDGSRPRPSSAVL